MPTVIQTVLMMRTDWDTIALWMMGDTLRSWYSAQIWTVYNGERKEEEPCQQQPKRSGVY